MTKSSAPNIAIACGGTGGHLFPGLAVAEQLQKRGCAVTLMVSPKEVDQQAIKSVMERRSPAGPAGPDSDQCAGSKPGVPIQTVTLPAVGLQSHNYFWFGRSFLKSLFAARKFFSEHRPAAALAMGGFTSAPPIFGARKFAAKTFLHESNTVPGRANRWLSGFVDQCFVGFPQAGIRLRNCNITFTGTPVRPQFQLRNPAACRIALGLEPERPTVLVMGGSQGASGINDIVTKALSSVTAGGWQWQFVHLAGPADVEKVRSAYTGAGVRAVVHAFFTEMELALGAATVAVSRSGASSLAELAAVRLPALLVPFPAATDNHQYFNAKAFEETGAARLLEQKVATPELVARLMLELIEDGAVRERLQEALAKWHMPHAAEQIADTMLHAIARENEPVNARSRGADGGCNCGEKHRVKLRAKTVV